MTRPALLIQVLAVNAALMAATVLAATLDLPPDPGVMAGEHRVALLVCAVVATALVNGVVLRRRLSPLEQLIAAMEGVDFSTRAQPAPPRGGEAEEVARLREAFEGMLDRIETERARTAGAVLQARESERARVARDLQDEAGPALTGLLARLQAAAEHAPEALREDLRETQGVATRAMDELLRLARDLRPVGLDDLGPAAAVRELVDDFGRRAGVEARLYLEPGALEALGADARIVAHRVVQEALANVARHAGARRVCVSAVAEDAVAVVRVDDDGRGFDERAAAPGLGLAGMRERALLAGGSVRVRSVPGEGTLVELRLPPEASAPAAG